MKPYLASIGYRGIIDINCIVNEDGAFPLEATCRAGSPIVHLQSELNVTPWAELMMAVAKGEPFDLKVKPGFGIVVVVAIPPFPFAKKIRAHSQVGTRLYFDDGMTKEEMRHVHFEEVSFDRRSGRHYISDKRGYVLYVTESGRTVAVAQRKAYGVLRKIVIPKMMYRNDIGDKFSGTAGRQLRKWGYLG
jgi:phosphoribosylamine--glycine ligase